MQLIQNMDNKQAESQKPAIANVPKKITKIKFEFLWAPFLLGSIAAQKITLGGEFYTGEVLAILFLALQFKKLKFTKTEKTFFQLALVWAGAQLVSDIINESELLDSIKGVLAPIIFASTTLGLITYFRKNTATKTRLKRTYFLNENMPSFLFGLTLANLLDVIFFPDLFAQDNPWKWGVGAAVVGLIAIYSSFFRRKTSISLLLILLILFFGVSLYFDARSLAVFPLLALLGFSIYKNSKGAWVFKTFGGDWGLAKLLIVLLTIIFLFNLLITLLFSSDLFLSTLSDASAEKFRSQSQGEYGALLGGRSEILISLTAFLDSPLWGHGSWAQDKTGKYVTEYVLLKEDLGYGEENLSHTLDALTYIPSHSYIMTAFVWAGLLGGLFWVYLLISTLKSFIKFMPQLPYYFYLGFVLLLWDIFFSPFGASERFSSAVFLSSYFSYIYHLRMIQRHY